ncbi:hypothetical protein D3C71_1715810 [compost metagenome]
MAQDGVGQVLRIDVGLRLAIGVERNQVGRLDGVIQADRFDLRQTTEQQEAAVGVTDRATIVFGGGDLIGTVTLRPDRAEGV